MESVGGYAYFVSEGTLSADLEGVILERMQFR